MADILETKDKQLASTIQRILSQGKPGVDEKKMHLHQTDFGYIPLGDLDQDQ